VATLIELIQTPIETAMSGLFEERVNKKSILLKFSNRKEAGTLKSCCVKISNITKNKYSCHGLVCGMKRTRFFFLE
jgi:hypothetical protein